MKQFTDITILLDRSGSMETIKESMETAFNMFIKEHKNTPTTKVTLVQFDSENDQDTLYQSVPVEAVEGLRLVPRGATPLLDALCKVIDRTGARYARMEENERPDQVLFVIITDGQENASKEYKRYNVYDRIKLQRNNYKWQFIYLGANQDAIGEAATFGIPSNFALSYAANSVGSTNAMRSLAKGSSSYTATVGNARGGAVPDFNLDDRTNAMDNETMNTIKTITKGKI